MTKRKREKKRHEIVIKRGDSGREISIDLTDYRAFLSFGLVGLTAFFAYIGNEAWREFAIMAGMAIAYWFRRGGGKKK